MNAEDFTKEFMAQLTGGGGGGPGGQNWTPNVTPVGQMPSKPSQPGQTFTKTSLAADKQVSKCCNISLKGFIFICENVYICELFLFVFIYLYTFRFPHLLYPNLN